MSGKAPAQSPKVFYLDTVESTNNYATALLDAGPVGHGTAVVAKRQTAGRGQRGRRWEAPPGEGLLASFVLHPHLPLARQPEFNMAVAVAVAGALQGLLPGKAVRVKWPNDVVIGGKKTAGILIENSLRGTVWSAAVVGVGINVLQTAFPPELPNAGSLRTAAGGAGFRVEDVFEAVHRALIRLPYAPAEPLAAYNALLYRRGEVQAFLQDGQKWMGTVREVGADGALVVEASDGLRSIPHGSVEWVWP